MGNNMQNTTIKKDSAAGTEKTSVKWSQVK